MDDVAHLQAVRGQDAFSLMSAGIHLLGYGGWGNTPAQQFLERGPLQHGATRTDYRLTERTGQLLLGLEASTPERMDALRDTMYEIFRPDAELTLVFTRHDRRVRAFDGVVGDGLPMDSSELERVWHRGRWRWLRKTAVELLCADPTAYDPDTRTVRFGVAASGNGTPIPTPIPTPIGASSKQDGQRMDYAGTVRAYPIITLVGPMANPTIHSLTTSERLTFTDLILGANERVVIDCRYGKKTIVDSANVSRFAALAEGSDLATFHLAPATRVGAARENVISVVATGTGPTSDLKIDYHERFAGV